MSSKLPEKQNEKKKKLFIYLPVAVTLESILRQARLIYSFDFNSWSLKKTKLILSQVFYFFAFTFVTIILLYAIMKRSQKEIKLDSKWGLPDKKKTKYKNLFKILL